MSLTLDTYRLLGRSGLRVSPLALGAATFGTERGWGAEQDEARKLFDLYVERGGNFIDTAITYTNGSSERLLGEFTRNNRESLVLATKYTTLRRPGDPNSGGPHRKSLFASVEASLRQLNTDYIDLLYLHVWDSTTPIERSCAAWTIWSGRARSCTWRSPTPRPGRCHACRRSPTCAAGRRWSRCRSSTT